MTNAQVEERSRRQDAKRQFVQTNADLRAIGCEHLAGTPEATAYLAGYAAALRFARETWK